MSPFSRPPEWQQEADRHSQLVDPVLTVRQISRFEFNRSTHSRIDHALVFATPKGGYEAYEPPHRPGRAEVAARKYTAMYEVDMGVHPFHAELRLPSDNDAFEFGAELDLSWQVFDPVAFVTSGHRQVPDLLIAELQRIIRPVTRRFPVAHSADAEVELLSTLRSGPAIGADIGLRTAWTLRLRRDRDAMEHQRRLRSIEHNVTEQVYATQQGMLYDHAFYARQAQQAELDLRNRAEHERHSHVHALEAQRQQHELAFRQGQFEIGQQEVLRQKVDFYAYYLEKGGAPALALQLAQRPDDIHQVMHSMREDHLRMVQAQMDLVRQLLAADTAEGYELEGPKQMALRAITEILDQRLPGATARAVPQDEAPPFIAPTTPDDNDTNDTQARKAVLDDVPAPTEKTSGTREPAPSWPSATVAPAPPVPMHAPTIPRTPVPPQASPAPPPVYVPPLAPAMGPPPGWQPPTGYGSVPAPVATHTDTMPEAEDAER